MNGSHASFWEYQCLPPGLQSWKRRSNPGAWGPQTCALFRKQPSKVSCARGSSGARSWGGMIELAR